MWESMTQFLSYLCNGISLGSVYAIIALGYTMVYGIAKMLNFAHGDVIMIGAYIAFCAMQYWGFPPVISVLAAMAVCTVLGMVIERTAYKPLRQASSLAVLITAIGMSYLLQNVALLVWGANPKSFPSVVSLGSLSLLGGQMTISGEAIVTIAACVVIGGFVSNLVAMNLAVTYSAGETVVSLQETLDGMMPSMLPLALTLVCFWLIDKKKVGPVPLMFIVMILGVIGSMAGILA